MISFSQRVQTALNYTSIKLACGTLVIKFCACSIVSSVFIYPFMWYLDDQLRRKLNLCMLLPANKNILCKNQIRIQNMY